jgi:hypothetical protein
MVSPDPASPWLPELFADAAIERQAVSVPGSGASQVPVPFAERGERAIFRLALSNGQEFHQIGTDLGLLPAPAALKELLIAPGERAT